MTIEDYGMTGGEPNLGLARVEYLAIAAFGPDLERDGKLPLTEGGGPTFDLALPRSRNKYLNIVMDVRASQAQTPFLSGNIAVEEWACLVKGAMVQREKPEIVKRGLLATGGFATRLYLFSKLGIETDANFKTLAVVVAGIGAGGIGGYNLAGLIQDTRRDPNDDSAKTFLDDSESGPEEIRKQLVEACKEFEAATIEGRKNYKRRGIRLMSGYASAVNPFF